MSKFKIGDSVRCINHKIKYIITDRFASTRGFVYLLQIHKDSDYRFTHYEYELECPIDMRDINFNKLLDE